MSKRQATKIKGANGVMPTLAEMDADLPTYIMELHVEKQEQVAREMEEEVRRLTKEFDEKRVQLDTSLQPIVRAGSKAIAQQRKSSELGGHFGILGGNPGKRPKELLNHVLVDRFDSLCNEEFFAPREAHNKLVKQIVAERGTSIPVTPKTVRNWLKAAGITPTRCDGKYRTKPPGK